MLLLHTTSLLQYESDRFTEMHSYMQSSPTAAETVKTIEGLSTHTDSQEMG